MAREDHWYIPGKNEVEKQQLHDHETLQILQRHARNGKISEFHALLRTIKDEDKQRDIIEMCDMEPI